MKRQSEEIGKRILDYVAAHQPVTFPQLYDGLGISKSWIEHNVAMLRDRGKLVASRGESNGKRGSPHFLLSLPVHADEGASGEVLGNTKSSFLEYVSKHQPVSLADLVQHLNLSYSVVLATAHRLENVGKIRMVQDSSDGHSGRIPFRVWLAHPPQSGVSASAQEQPAGQLFAPETELALQKAEQHIGGQSAYDVVLPGGWKIALADDRLSISDPFGRVIRIESSEGNLSVNLTQS